MLRDSLLLASRSLLGGYLAAHGAQKLFGSFGGHGVEGTGGFFESVGLKPGKAMAATAGASELAGGTLTVAGLAHPIGPAAIASTMAVAAGTVHTGQGAFASSNGPELPLANLAASLALAATDPGRFSLDRALGRSLPVRIGAIALSAGAGAAAAIVARAHAARDDRSPETSDADDASADDASADADTARQSA